jgi:deoxyribonuclease-4
VTGRIDLLHCNSSRDAPGTGADRHANIATGQMDPSVILDMVQTSQAPVVVFETPWAGIADDLAWLRRTL